MTATRAPRGGVAAHPRACGTPVVAVRRGSVPEVLEHGRTGIIVQSHDELPEGIAEVDRIDPAECRRAAEERFSPGVLVDGYVRAFRAAIELVDGSATLNAAATSTLSAGHA